MLVQFAFLAALAVAATAVAGQDGPVPSSTDRAAAVEMSLDRGRTWLPVAPGLVSESPASASEVLFRARDSAGFISLPACAASEGPGAVVWSSLGALGVDGRRACVPGSSFEPRFARVAPLPPKWHQFMHNPDELPSSSGKTVQSAADAKKKKKQEKRKRGFLKTYGIYIAIFVAISLFQGIREGNAQYQQEMEAERRKEEAQKAGAQQGPTIRVPRRKTGKEKRKKSAAASAK